ncbi:hydrolase [Pseudonocardia sp. C8]|uniref:nitrilase-related carbon-nitrogen hydrolase n=1 Tax=Pseudonocardia sp. C8 TaxID=2762759 RepID=UPI00164267ED|nr:nitrilase-related carbon-nitrogen hydrolase [Pseudonocardia sp. C8]MBC3190421.1 hydrolase [Pseudonocardia sp. C8]
MASPPGTTTVAAAQFAAGRDVTENLDRIDALVGRAAASAARLVALPEASMYAWDAPADELAAAARASAADFTAGIEEIARRHAVMLVAGAFAADDDDPRPYNRLLVVGPDGPRASYDKVHLYDAFDYRESDRVRPGPVHADGSELVTVDVGGVTMGLLNCYDLRFPEQARALVERGADLLVVSSAWVNGPRKELHWELLLRARAVENTCYVLAASQPPPTSTGLSMAVDPMGLVMATCTEDEGIVSADLSPQRLHEVRRIVPCLANRRYPVQHAASATASGQ